MLGDLLLSLLADDVLLFGTAIVYTSLAYILTIDIVLFSSTLRIYTVCSSMSITLFISFAVFFRASGPMHS